MPAARHREESDGLRVRGTGFANGHHGELLQGVFRHQDGLHRGLVTLPCAEFVTRAEIELAAGAGAVVVDPPWKTKAGQAVRHALDAVGLPEDGAVLRIESDVRAGCGFGSSSSDVIASINAVVDATGCVLPRLAIAGLAVRAETASDPLMFDHALLFAQREGVVLENFATTLPELAILGFQVRDEPVDTLSFPPARYSQREIEAFRPILGRLRRGIAMGVVSDIAEAATASARINQRFLPVPRFEELVSICGDGGAEGVQVAHSGNIAGLIFDGMDPEVDRRMDDARRRLAELGLDDHWMFRTVGSTGGSRR
jgi:uncharacterized protein involved in propanediol utilization